MTARGDAAQQREPALRALTHNLLLVAAQG